MRRSGRGPDAPLVLLHGNSGTSVGWWTVVEPLAKAHEVLAVDVIGTIGRSVQTRPLEQPADLAVWFRELLDGLGVELPELQWELMTAGARQFRPGLPMPAKVSDGDLRRMTTPTLLYMAGESEVYEPREGGHACTGPHARRRDHHRRAGEHGRRLLARALDSVLGADAPRRARTPSARRNRR